MTETKKRCPRCNQSKHLDDFQKQPSGKHGRFTYCKPCASAYYRDKRKRSYSAEQKFRWQIMTRYRMTIDQYMALRTLQQGRCAICKVSSDALAVDHCHATNEIRGLLCKRCNLMLGVLEKREWLDQAKGYLDDHARNPVMRRIGEGIATVESFAKEVA